MTMSNYKFIATSGAPIKAWVNGVQIGRAHV